MSVGRGTHIETMLADDEYRRQRLNPRPGDTFYLHLADLLLAVNKVRTDEVLAILDFGAGVSPYRSMFRNSQYSRADVSAVADVDYLISRDGRVAEKTSVFDLVLSTQVVEHVTDPGAYFSECFRVLKPGGNLVLTTHGLFEDHSSPDDFQRWTAQGLRRDLEQVGFEVVTLDKITTGPRAVMFFMDRYLDTMRSSRRTLPGLMHWTIKTLARPFRGLIHAQLDRFYREYRVVSSEVENHNIYIALMACARRP